MKRTNKDRKVAALITAWGILFILAIGYIGYCNSNQPEKNRLMKQSQLIQLMELDK